MHKAVFTFFCVLFAGLSGRALAFNTDAFQAANWVAERAHDNHVHKFIVSLKLRNRDSMKQEFHDVSNPKHANYGKFLTLEDLRMKYSPSGSDVMSVRDYFGSIAGSKVELNTKGDLLTVTAPASLIEQHLGTSLMWHKHVSDASVKRSLRATSPLSRIPDHISDKIAFLSLNSPINHMIPRSSWSQQSATQSTASGTGVTTQAGNKEALVKFFPLCGSTGVANNANPPCAGSSAADIPKFVVTVLEYSNTSLTSPLLNPNPLVFELSQDYIFCYNNITKSACAGDVSGYCTCVAKVAPLPMYTQLSATVVSTLPSGEATDLGTSPAFVLTDVATVSFLSELYNVPQGMKVTNLESTQAVAEFYGEYYSNADLAQFLHLSGLLGAAIPSANVFMGTNNQSDVGGEAQLDVEYLMGLAPGAPTFFYSVDDLNPFDPENEGFLSWLTFVGNQASPPLVQSLSYGDVEASIFTPDNQDAYDYGTRCDEEFMQLGLRGVTILVASGDDGLGGTQLRDDYELACSQAWPEWPGGSPYITSVGATQLTDQYLPGCGQPYASPETGVPLESELLFLCSGSRETVCSAATGGVITSGGGFSNVNQRADTASWQTEAVNGYLAQTGAYPSTPGYFNAAGRAYPDVSTYGSNYFVYIDGHLTRESGTSASTPVFAAMVTLWNDIRFTYGMQPMGFINPFLYQAWESTPEAFNDIVTGDNGCGVNGFPCCPESFAAVPGWDAASGLGSPNFQVLSNLVINSDSAFPSISAFPDGYGTSNAGEETTQTKTLVIVALSVAVLSCMLALFAMWRLHQVKSTYAYRRGINSAAYAALDAPFLGVNGKMQDPVGSFEEIVEFRDSGSTGAIEKDKTYL